MYFMGRYLGTGEQVYVAMKSETTGTMLYVLEQVRKREKDPPPPLPCWLGSDHTDVE